jgi:hypothetical protein
MGCSLAKRLIALEEGAPRQHPKNDERLGFGPANINSEISSEGDQ